jgi:hypothetical protein
LLAGVEVAETLAVAVGVLVNGEAVGDCANDEPAAKAREQREIIINLFIMDLNVGCGSHPVWIQQFHLFHGN